MADFYDQDAEPTFWSRFDEQLAKRGHGAAPRGIMLAHYHTYTGDQWAEQGDWNAALYHWSLARDAMEN